MSWEGHCQRLWTLWRSALIAGTQNLICMCEYKIIWNSWFSQRKWTDVKSCCCFSYVAASLHPNAAECHPSQMCAGGFFIRISFKILPHLSLLGRHALHVNRSGVGCRQHRTLFLKIPVARLCTSVWFPPLLPARADVKAKVGSLAPVQLWRSIPWACLI